MAGPHSGKCARPLCGPGILMLGLASSEGLGVTGGAGGMDCAWSSGLAGVVLLRFSLDWPEEAKYSFDLRAVS